MSGLPALLPCLALCVLFLVQASYATQNQALLAEEFLQADRPLKCQRLKNRFGAMCSSFGYNMTLMPNLLNHERQREAFAHFQGFSHLLDTGCSAELPFLLCAFHFPMCSMERDPSIAPDLITPCRSLCTRVRDDCLPTMQANGFQWPEQMNCEKLQVKPLVRTREDERIVCVDRPLGNAVTAPREFATCPPISCDTVKMKKKTFTKGIFHFAIEATYLGGYLQNDRKELQVRVDQIHHFCSAVPSDVSQVKIGAMIGLRTEQTDLCSCPDLEHGATYLFTGYIGARGRLMVDSHRSIMSTVAPNLRQKTTRRVKKWMKRFCKKYQPDFFPTPSA